MPELKPGREAMLIFLLSPLGRSVRNLGMKIASDSFQADGAKAEMPVGQHRHSQCS